VIHSEFGVAGWLESFARLADHYDVVVPSLPGYGRSTRPDWIMSVHDLAEPQPDRFRCGREQFVRNDPGRLSMPKLGASVSNSKPLRTHMLFVPCRDTAVVPRRVVWLGRRQGIEMV
jgi:pimeloyl-ACP methyl ester carboxylesterase